MSSFHEPGHRPAYRLPPVRMVRVFQHCVRGLRSAASDTAIELADRFDVWALKTNQDDASLVFADHVHDCEHTRRDFPADVIVITFAVTLVCCRIPILQWGSARRCGSLKAVHLY